MSITWLGKVGCCKHGIWFRDTEYVEPRPCTYCNQEAETPEGKILEEFRELRKTLNRR